MKKREKKLQLNRETVRKLNPEELAKAEGGVEVLCTGSNSACTECGNC
jgi:hypothetical protein